MSWRREMNIFKPLAIWMLALLASPALAGFGGQDGGGGGVIRCEKADNGSIFISRMVKGKRQFIKLPSPTSLSHNREYQFLDLWEAEVGSGPSSITASNCRSTNVQLRNTGSAVRFHALEKLIPNSHVRPKNI